MSKPSTLAEESPNVTIEWVDRNTLPKTQLVDLLKIFGDLLPDPLSERVDLSTYAEKLQRNAEIALAYQNEQIVGFLIMYANDNDTRKAHIPLITVLQSYRGRGIGKVLISRAIALARQRKMLNLWLTVDDDNKVAQHVYSQLRFVVSGKDEPKLIMSRDLSASPLLLEPQITAIEPGNILASELGLDIDLRIKRDDLYPFPGGGIKARKIGFIMKKAIEDGYDAIVTNGGPQSNHARSAAILAANLGIKCHLVIVLKEGKKYSKSGNILLMKLTGASVEYTSKDLLSMSMDRAIENLSKEGHKPLYIWGGGHNLQGTIAFVEAAAEARGQCGDWIPDYLILASGTGSTHAGLAIGYADLGTKVVGISVARESARGGKIIEDCINDYYQQTSIPPEKVNIHFLDNWTSGGYEEYEVPLFNIIEKAARCGQFFDPTYSGKALLGLTALVNNGEIPRESKVLLWHTGGLMNLQAVLHYTEGTFSR